MVRQPGFVNPIPSHPRDSGLREVQHRTDGNNSRGIDVVVRDVVMAFDVVEVHGFGGARLLIQKAVATLGWVPESAVKMSSPNSFGWFDFHSTVL
jgi:hypothetical protein